MQSLDFKERTVKQRRSLFVSAGHSNTDPGAAGNGFTEADFVLDLRDRVYKELDSRGIVLSTDGEKGDNLPLREAVVMAAQHEVAIELHCNSFARPSATGTETLSGEWLQDFPEALCAVISDTLGISNRGDKGEGSGQHSRLAFVSKGHGVIVELFFISNPQDVRKYLDNKEKVVEAICDVLEVEVCKEEP